MRLTYLIKSGASADEDLLRRRFGTVAHAIAHEPGRPIFHFLIVAHKLSLAIMESIQSIGLQRAANPGPVQVIAVTGGKGGVGKTSVSVNLATALASTGRRVMLLDGDLRSGERRRVPRFVGALHNGSRFERRAHARRNIPGIAAWHSGGAWCIGWAELANLSAAGHLSLVQAFQRHQHASRYIDRRYVCGHRS